MSRRVDLAILCWQPIPVDRSSLLSKVGALACVLVCLIGSKRGWGEEKQSAAQLFLNEVQPMLKSKCFGCHGEGERLRGGLDLRSRAAMLKGGDSGPALVPGSAEKSLLYQAVLRTGDVVMPPKESARLSENEVRALKRWIDEGAVWPAAQFAGNKQYDPKDVWAYQPITRPRVPSIAGEVKTPIDAFILRKLKQHDLEPAVRADRVTLIRRAYFDLIGLPPTPQEIEAFVADDSPLAFDKVIDRLLASPHYGERMAQHWLDVVRYADTSGFANDFERPHAWRYRDYVIKSFNDDKPYDRFVIEQLAGDELDASNAENLIATGFLRMGPWEHTAMSVAAITRQFYLDDITNNVGVTFLAQALRCARCHDHKFDPVPTRDYYRIQAVFAATQFAEREVPFQRWENTADFANVAADVDRQLGTKIRPLTKENTANTQRMVSVKRDAYYKLARQRTKPLCFSVRSGKPQTVAILERGSLQSPGEVVTPWRLECGISVQ
ncbi:MAG: hypothetical protein KatS3mg105_3897 [Gemmatales bacterium]|nr:MAG: hypothetical protein KatS3mg105_3897 [Gemmatales bacterium]